MRILALCGSLQARSSNRELLLSAQRLAAPDATLELFEELGALPHFNPDLESKGQPSVMVLRKAITESAALLIATPEYGFSLPGVLKNAIDWLIGSAELERKLVAITAAVPVPERGRLGLQALRQTLSAVSARVVWQEPIVKGPEFEAQVQKMMHCIIGAAAAQPEPL